jgi:hypothetical protein
VSVFARFDEATKERPIPIRVTWNVEGGHVAPQDLMDWATYGTSFSAPLGSADLLLDLPGGLDGELKGAAVSIGPGEVGTSYQLRAEIIEPSGAVVESVLLDMDPVTTGVTRTGSSASGQEHHSTFAIEIRANFSAEEVKLSVSGLDLTGKRPAEVLPGLRFLVQLRAPNALRLALPYGPAHHSGIPLPEEFGSAEEQGLVLEVVEALATIQGRTSVQIFVPDLTLMTHREADHLIRTARLLRGEAVSTRWESLNLRIRADAVPDEPAFTVVFDEPLSVRIGDANIELGKVRTQLMAARFEVVEQVEPDADGLVPARLAPFGDNREACLMFLPEIEGGERAHGQ